MIFSESIKTTWETKDHRKTIYSEPKLVLSCLQLNAKHITNDSVINNKIPFQYVMLYNTKVGVKK